MLTVESGNQIMFDMILTLLHCRVESVPESLKHIGDAILDSIPVEK